MCGIIAYIGEERVLPILLNGLRRLEYRGYDSAGLAILDNHDITLLKTKGRVEDLNKLTESKDLQGTTGIAHTRWATHGIPNEINAHPHFSCNKDIVLVHNGIIENYLTIKKYLESKGHKFITETDTEVVVHLIEEFNRQNSFEESVRLALNELKGAYGLAILNKKENKIIGARKGSPLIIGKNEKGVFIASDASAFLEYTKTINYLEDGEMVIATPNNFEIRNINKQEIRQNLQEINLS